MKYYLRILPYCVFILLLIAGCGKQEERPVEEDAEMEKSSGYVTVNGFKLRYLIKGTGITTLVIGSATYYSRTFSHRLHDHLKLIFVDMKGFVPTDTAINVDEFTMDAAVEDVENIRKALSLEKMAVMGHSMFALMALEYAKKYPERTSQIIMIAMSPHYNDSTLIAGSKYWESQASDERKLLWKQNQEKLTEEILSSVSPSEAFIMRYVASGPRRWYQPTYDASWLWEGVQPNMDILNHHLGPVFMEYDITQGLERVTMPVFLAVGRHDYGIPYYLWDEFKPQMPTLSYHLFEKSGHHPMLEEQELFDKKLIEWISSH